MVVRTSQACNIVVLPHKHGCSFDLGNTHQKIIVQLKMKTTLNNEIVVNLEIELHGEMNH